MELKGKVSFSDSVWEFKRNITPLLAQSIWTWQANNFDGLGIWVKSLYYSAKNKIKNTNKSKKKSASMLSSAIFKKVHALKLHHMD